MPIPDTRPTWATSDRRLARYLAQPTARFLAIEASGGVLLLVGSLIALVWVNSPWSDSYHTLWETDLVIGVGRYEFSETLGHVVNDGLMAIFFFVVGLEIKREMVTGHLSSVRDAALPVAAAIGGMLVPAGIYLAVNAGGDGSAGWGIPMATDIAFAVGVLALLGPRIPASLKVFLLGLAVADDIGAIAVIAVAYTDTVAFAWMTAAVVGVAGVVLMRRAHVWWTPAYVVVGTVVWFCTLESGIHATIAGVVLGLLAPARPLLPPPEADAIADRLSTDVDVTADEVREISFEVSESVSVAERLERQLHPWTSYLIVPIFALANAGIPISRDALGDAATSPVTIGVIAGLVLGKLLGVSLFAYLAVRLGIARLPDDVTWRHVVGVGALAGIGFTVSIFVSGLAFDAPELHDQARLGILVASASAALLGVVVLRRATGGE